MLHVAVLVCSDPACAERSEHVATLAELDALLCDCGGGLLVLGWPDPLPPPAAVSVPPEPVALGSRRRRGAELPLAA